MSPNTHPLLPTALKKFFDLIKCLSGKTWHQNIGFSKKFLFWTFEMPKVCLLKTRPILKFKTVFSVFLSVHFILGSSILSTHCYSSSRTVFSWVRARSNSGFSRKKAKRRFTEMYEMTIGGMKTWVLRLTWDSSNPEVILA